MPKSKLRELLDSGRPIVAVGAHNALTARLVERAGFDAVWASGFEVSASFGLPDANLVSMADSIEVGRLMSSSVSMPIILDCDNGYGGVSNVMHLVRKCEEAGIAAICIEDNAFPKRCSFYETSDRNLVSTGEFVAKIKAACDARLNDDFLIMARTEALICGLGMGEALERAKAYAEAGADMIVIHSKKEDVGEIRQFASLWEGQTPLVAIPTTYKHASVAQLESLGIRVIIFANAVVRSSIKAVSETLEVLKRAGSMGAIDPLICTLDKVYDLVNVKGLLENEEKYNKITEPIAVNIFKRKDSKDGGVDAC